MFDDLDDLDDDQGDGPDEMDRRRPDWSPGVQVEMTDGGMWTLPLIDARVLADAPVLPDLASCLDCRVVGFQVEAVKMIAAYLLAANYELSLTDTVPLVPLEFDQDPDGNYCASDRFFSLSVIVRGLAAQAGLATTGTFAERASAVSTN